MLFPVNAPNDAVEFLISFDVDAHATHNKKTEAENIFFNNLKFLFPNNKKLSIIKQYNKFYKKAIKMICLGIESSCDETAVAIINDKGEILAHQLITQFEEHSPYGGVVPEIASRSHLNYIDKLINKALFEANLSINDIDIFSAGNGPGLIGGVIVGVNMAKSLAFATNKPFIAVNHLEAHALMPMMFNKDLKFPYMLLLVSGGHTQILIVEGVGKYKMLGTTIDDACGECFDKVAKMLGWDYMGGKEIEKSAINGNAKAFDFPRPMLHSHDLNFSFSGLKTSVRTQIEKLKNIDEKTKSDICASFQSAIVEILDKKLISAIKQNKNIKYLVAGGGVSSNSEIRKTLENIGSDNDIVVSFAPPKYCTDNGVMIAYAGILNYIAGKTSSLSTTPHPRWNLEDL